MHQVTFVKCECSKCQGLVMCGDRQLLPTAVKPAHYELNLAPKLEDFTYKGTLKVTLTVQEPCVGITFHARDLTISSGIVTDASGKERTNPGGPDVLYGSKEQETATVALAKPFTETDVGSTVTLELVFTGELNDKLAGAYSSTAHLAALCGRTIHLVLSLINVTRLVSSESTYGHPAAMRVSHDVPRDTSRMISPSYQHNACAVSPAITILPRELETTAPIRMMPKMV
eukprot:7452376-Pyramimonas_sp.AAC.1